MRVGQGVWPKSREMQTNRRNVECYRPTSETELTVVFCGSVNEKILRQELDLQDTEKTQIKLRTPKYNPSPKPHKS